MIQKPDIRKGLAHRHMELRTMGKFIIWIELEKSHKALTSKEITDSSTEDTCQKLFPVGCFQRCSKNILMMIKGANVHVGTDVPFVCANSNWIMQNNENLDLQLLLGMFKLVICACNVLR